MQQSRPRSDWLLLIGFCGYLFFFGINYFGLVGADEPRYAQVAREMLNPRPVPPFSRVEEWNRL